MIPPVLRVRQRTRVGAGAAGPDGATHGRRGGAAGALQAAVRGGAPHAGHRRDDLLRARRRDRGVAVHRPRGRPATHWRTLVSGRRRAGGLAPEVARRRAFPARPVPAP